MGPPPTGPMYRTVCFPVESMATAIMPLLTFSAPGGSFDVKLPVNRQAVRRSLGSLSDQLDCVTDGPSGPCLVFSQSIMAATSVETSALTSTGEPVLSVRPDTASVQGNAT